MLETFLIVWVSNEEYRDKCIVNSNSLASKYV